MPQAEFSVVDRPAAGIGMPQNPASQVPVTLTGVSTWIAALIDLMSDPCAAEQGLGVPDALNSNDVARQELRPGRMPR
jgi:hypothetical protein